MFPDDEAWDEIYKFLNDEGRNDTGKWNDTCGVLMDDGTDTLEFGCGDGGVLLKCTHCHAAFHFDCCGLGDQRKKAPKGDFACPACVSHARQQINARPAAAAAAAAGTSSVHGKPSSFEEAVLYCEQHGVDYGKSRTLRGVLRKLRAAAQRW